MKLFAVFGIALFATVSGTTFENNCIRLDVDGTVTVTATINKTEENATIDLSKAAHTVTGNCSDVNTTVVMTVTFTKLPTMGFTFTNKNNMVQMQQSVSFDPSTLFNNTAMTNETLSLTNTLPLSSSNTSYLCHAQQTISFKPTTQGNYTYAVSQKISNLQVQAFGLVNKTFTNPPEECSADTPTPTPTPPMVPTAAPVTAQTFVVKDTKGAVCFRLEAGLQFTVEYNNTNNTMVFSKVMTIPSSANVTGTCATNSSNTATMVITEAKNSLTITETRSKTMATSGIKLSVYLDPTNFPHASAVNQTKTFAMADTFGLSSADTFYMCNSEQTLQFNNSRTTLYADKVRLQAFNLNNGSFSGNGVECSLDPTPSPMPPASSPGDNTYTVSKENHTCIVFKGEIFFSNISYAVKGGMQKADTINIPAMNMTTGNVKFSGNCDLEGGDAQQLIVTFNKNWKLALTFIRGWTNNTVLLTEAGTEYGVRDVVFTYFLTPEFFPNATQAGTKQVASQMNITGSFMTGTRGGSYKCDSKNSETLSNYVQFQTANLQYKAFNDNNSTAFNSDVTECAADDNTNSIVPIAVGAALAGLVVIVLIAYLIGRQRSRRQGYESV